MQVVFSNLFTNILTGFLSADSYSELNALLSIPCTFEKVFDDHMELPALVRQRLDAIGITPDCISISYNEGVQMCHGLHIVHFTNRSEFCEWVLSQPIPETSPTGQLPYLDFYQTVIWEEGLAYLRLLQPIHLIAGWSLDLKYTCFPDGQVESNEILYLNGGVKVDKVPALVQHAAQKYLLAFQQVLAESYIPEVAE